MVDGRIHRRASVDRADRNHRLPRITQSRSASIDTLARASIVHHHPAVRATVRDPLRMTLPRSTHARARERRARARDVQNTINIFQPTHAPASSSPVRASRRVVVHINHPSPMGRAGASKNNPIAPTRCDVLDRPRRHTHARSKNAVDDAHAKRTPRDERIEGRRRAARGWR